MYIYIYMHKSFIHMFIYMRGAYSAFFSEFYLARAVQNLFICGFDMKNRENMKLDEHHVHKVLRYHISASVDWFVRFLYMKFLFTSFASAK